jgi:hypothetical protein
VGVVSARLSNEATRQAFQAGGLDPDYEVAGAMTYGAARPEVEITAFGSSPDQTVETRTALVEGVQRHLRAVQKEEGVASYYMVRGLAVEPIREPQELTSRALRSLLAVGAIGAIVLFAAISLLTAWDQIRAERTARAVTNGDRYEDSAGPAPAHRAGRRATAGRTGEDVDAERPEPARDGFHDDEAQPLVPAK